MKSILFTLGAAGVWSAMTVCGAQEILLTKSGGDITKPDSWGGNPLVPGYDYVVPSGYNLDMTQNSWSGTYRFPGDHLVFRNNTASFWWENCGDTRWLDVNLVVESGAPRLWPNNAGVMINLLGTVQINAGAVLRVST